MSEFTSRSNVTRPSRFRSLWLALLLLPAASAVGFEVVKNVNSGKPPEEAIVLFDKSAKNDDVVLSDVSPSKFTKRDDGAIEARITGNAAIQPTIAWKAGRIPETINLRDYAGVLVTLRVEGLHRQKMGAKVSEIRAENLWLALTFLNDKGERIGLANPADVTDDRKTPAETTTIFLPMILFTMSPNDPTTVKSFGAYWNATRPEIDRDYTLVIEKIALTK